MNPAKLMGSTELAVRIGATEKQIDTWCKLGHLKEEPRAHGTGNKRRFKPAEVRVAQIMAAMVNAGINPRVAARAARTAILEADSRGPLFMAELRPGVAVTGRIDS